jgi:hypothetical protein
MRELEDSAAPRPGTNGWAVIADRWRNAGPMYRVGLCLIGLGTACWMAGGLLLGSIEKYGADSENIAGLNDRPRRWDRDRHKRHLHAATRLPPLCRRRPAQAAPSNESATKKTDRDNDLRLRLRCGVRCGDRLFRDASRPRSGLVSVDRVCAVLGICGGVCRHPHSAPTGIAHARSDSRPGMTWRRR